MFMTSGASMIFLILFALLSTALSYGVVIYNKLVRFRTTVRSSWSDIDVQLKKRYNLVPNPVETVKGYAAHESTVLVGVTEARTATMQATGPGEKARTENIFSQALKSLFAVAEAYPELKANENFMQLQQQLVTIEGDIESARRYYNAVVRENNILTQAFTSRP